MSQSLGGVSHHLPPPPYIISPCAVRAAYGRTSCRTVRVWGGGGKEGGSVGGSFGSVMTCHSTRFSPTMALEVDRTCTVPYRTVLEYQLNYIKEAFVFVFVK